MLVPGNYWSINILEYWTSLTDVGVEGSYKWCYANSYVDFTPTSLNAFQKAQPDNYLDSEHCGNMMVATGTSAYLAHNDISCSRQFHFACEVIGKMQHCNVMIESFFQAPLSTPIQHACPVDKEPEVRYLYNLLLGIAY
jgi:hypothetical protein